MTAISKHQGNPVSQLIGQFVEGIHSTVTELIETNKEKNDLTLRITEAAKANKDTLTLINESDEVNAKRFSIVNKACALAFGAISLCALPILFGFGTMFKLAFAVSLLVTSHELYCIADNLKLNPGQFTAYLGTEWKATPAFLMTVLTETLKTPALDLEDLEQAIDQSSKAEKSSQSNDPIDQMFRPALKGCFLEDTVVYLSKSLMMGKIQGL